MRVNRSSSRGRVAIVAAAVVVAGALGLQAAAADTTSTFVVNTTTDSVDARVGDNLCLTGSGMCTLRAAIQEANAHPGADVVEVPAGTYALGFRPLNQNDITTGDLDITDSLEVRGAGAGATIIDAGVPLAGASPEVRGLDRLFEVHAHGGAVSISGVTLSDGYAAEYGGAIMNNSTAAVTVTSSMLTGNVAGKTGGAIDNHLGGAVEVRDSTVSGNFAAESGSALNNNRDGALTVVDSTIAMNSATVVGLDEALAGAGAISNNAELDAVGSIVVSGSQLSGNHAGGGRSGGSISNDGTGTVTVDRSTFSANAAAAHGGAISNVAGEVTVTDSSFTENSGTDGGAIDGTGTTTVSRSTFGSNSASANGGAISSGGNGTLTVLDSTFSKNRAEDWGGAVHNSDKGAVAILNTAFLENAGLTGGGFGNEGSGLVTVEDTTFTKNVAFATAVLTEGEGGGMHSNSGGEVVIARSAFTENDALSGGGLGNEGGGQLSVTGTRFSSNTADEQGGGVLIQSGAVRMLDVDVTGNVAGAPEEGGGGIAYAGDKAVSIGETAAIQDSRIRDNRSAGEGGGIDSRGDGPLVITTTSITGNTAAIGGAIHHVGDAPLEVTRSTLSGNLAESGGGVFADGDGEALIENATVSNNRAAQFGGGVLVSSRVTVRSSTVAENSAASGGGIDNGGGDLVGDGFVFVANSIVAGSATGGNCAGVVTSRGGNIDSADTCRFRELTDQPGTNPLLGALADNGGPTRTHALLTGSPAQEKAACSELDPCPTVDQRGLERPMFVGVDVGAYESELPPDGSEPQECAGRIERPVPADFDSTVSQGSPGTNFGTDASLNVESEPGGNQRALLHFALPSVPPGCKLVGATLRVHSSSATAGRTLQALRVVSAWSELGATWSNQPATAGAAATSDSGLGMREWDVLAQTRDMYTLGGHGFLLRDAVENVSGQQSFHSREKGELPPELVLVFDDPDGTPKPGSCPKTPQTLSADRDSWVSQGSPSNNFGSDSSLKVKSQGGANSRALVHFPLPPLPPGCTGVASASLRLEAASAKEGRTLEVRRLVSAWSEAGVTWSNRPGVSGAAASTPSAGGPLDWDVASQVEAGYLSAHHGFEVRDREEDGIGDEQTLNSREKLNDGPPELVLVFTDATPETTIDAGPPSSTDSAEATFTFSSDQDDATFECALDDAEFAACSSPYTARGLSEGEHRLQVRATRKVRAVDPTPATYDWTVAIPPETTVDGPDSPSASADATLTFASDDPAATFECSLNGEPYAACTSPVDYVDLGDGEQQFRVRAIDALGSADPSPAIHTWTVAVPPETTIVSGPADPSNSTSASVAFGADEPGTFECRLDDGAWQDCVSPVAYIALADGRHTVEVRATDRAGNRDESPASHSWTVDTVAPRPTIVSGPPDPTSSTEAELAFDADEPAGFECRLDGGAWAPCVSPVEYQGLADGRRVVEVRATDRAGNRSESPAIHTWRVDTVAPETTIGSGPVDPTNNTSASLSFSADEDAGFDCRLDHGEWAACSSPRAYEHLADGRHELEVRATDRAGNVDESPASYAWTVDTVAPETTITSGPADPTRDTSATFGLSASEDARFECRLDGGDWAGCGEYTGLLDGDHLLEARAIDPAGNVDATPATYAWAVDTVAPVTTISSGPAALSDTSSASFAFGAGEQAEFECRLDAGDWAACESPQGYADLADGEHTFQVRATDAAGNLGPAASYAWTIELLRDVTAPETTITERPADPSSSSSATFAFTASETATFECRLDDSAWTGCASPQAYADLPDGDHTFHVRATDTAGNLGDAVSYTWTVDTTAPVTTISSGPAALSNTSSASFAFSAGEPAEFECKLDAGDWAACESPQSYVDLADGEHTFQARATDAAGNVGVAASYGWSVDTVAPSVTIEQAPSDPKNSRSASFGFGADEVSTFECRLDAGEWSACTSPQGYADLPDGDHTFHLRATDAAGNVGPAASYAWAVDTVAPETTISSGPAALSNTSSASFAFSAGEEAGFECRLDAGDWAACGSPQAYADLADGEHTFHVRATDAAGNVGVAASYAWTVDTTAPVSTISSGPAALTNVSSASFAFSAGEQAEFECRLDAGDWAACESPQAYADVADGEHTFRVRATDAAGNVGVAASYGWTVDTVAPSVTIEQAPSDPTNSRSASFAFTASETATFECRLDAGEWSACTSPQGYADLSDGDHSFQVRATDAAGNVGDAVSYAWTIELRDVTAPETTITERPVDPSSTSSASFAFTASEPAEFECRLDAGDWAVCSSPRHYTDLADGDHEFVVRATDAAGNVGAAASYAWAVDTVAPVVRIESAPANPTTDRAARFEFAAGEPAAFECRLDGAEWTACESPQAYEELAVGEHTFHVRATDAAGNGGAVALYTWTIELPRDVTAPETTITERPADPSSSSSATFAFTASETATFECRLDAGDWAACESPQGYADLADGEHTFRVRATDAAGNVGDAVLYTWTVDTTAPVTTIASGPAARTNVSSASFAFGAGQDAGFECRLDDGPWTACVSPQGYANLADGDHSFRVRATDAAGNVGPAASYAWTVDTTAPVTTISSGPAALSNTSSASFAFGASETATFECRLDAGDWAACESPQRYADLADGEHTFRVRATDAAGNGGDAVSYTWTVDTTAPVTTIASGPTALTNSSSATFAFTASEPAEFECRLDAGDWAACETPQAYADLANGEHTFRVRATDAARNGGDAVSYAWTVDTVAPSVTIEQAPSDPTNSRSASFAFGADEDASFECRLDAGDWAACETPQVYADLADGEHTFQVRATDAAGNAGAAATHTWTIELLRDVTAPETTITERPADPSSSSSASFAFTASEPAEFECKLDDGPWTACSSPQGYADLPEGEHTFRVRATDAAGNVGDAVSYTWTVDTVAPQTGIDARPSELTNSTRAEFAFSAGEGDARFECSIDGGAYVACTSPREYAGLAASQHRFSVRATDAAGNTDATPATHTWTIDTTAPETTIGAAPPATTTSTSASFTFTADDPSDRFECSIDGAAFATCSAPREYTGLGAGEHRFSVRATDAAGNTDVTPATHAWTISEPPPPPPPPEGCGAPVTAPATSDAWIDENSSTTNKGADPILKVQSKGPRDNFRALLRFDLPVLPPGCTVESATLRLYAASARTGRTIQAVRVAAPWSESQVTWTNQPQTAGSAATTTSGLGWREWGVASQVRAMYAGGNHGFLVRDAFEGHDAEQQFHSREKGENVPQLVLRFAEGTSSLAAFDAGPSAHVSTFSARATRTGRIRVPPATFAAYRFACERACSGTMTGRLTAAQGRAATVKLKPARFRGGPGARVETRVSLPAKAMRLIKKRKRAKLKLMTVLRSGGSSARLPATIRLGSQH